MSFAGDMNTVCSCSFACYLTLFLKYFSAHFLHQPPLPRILGDRLVRWFMAPLLIRSRRWATVWSLKSGHGSCCNAIRRLCPRAMALTCWRGRRAASAGKRYDIGLTLMIRSKTYYSKKNKPWTLHPWLQLRPHDLWKEDTKKGTSSSEVQESRAGSWLLRLQVALWSNGGYWYVWFGPNWRYMGIIFLCLYYEKYLVLV